MSVLAATGSPGEAWWIALIEAILIVNLVLVTFAYTTLVERKLLGRMQLRYGPNRAGPFGLLQPIADLIKLIRKESFFPVSSVDTLMVVAPAISTFTALAAFAVIPFGPGCRASARAPVPAAGARDRARADRRREPPDPHR